MSQPPDHLIENQGDILAAEIRLRHATSFKEEWRAGKVKSPIRGVTRMVEDCRTEMLKTGLEQQASTLLNLAIGDIDPVRFEIDNDNSIAYDMGLDPNSPLHELMSSFVKSEEKRLWQTTTSATRYQLEAIGIPALRQEFANFINGCGTSYSVEQTILDYGGLGGTNTTLEYAASQARREGVLIHFINPTPSFNVIAAQARDLGLPIVSLSTKPEDGYCPTADSLELVMPTQYNDRDILYLTPMNNPTSTLYEPKVLKATLEKFHTLRPKGIIMVDLAYLDMVDRQKAQEIIGLFKTTNTLDQAVMITSMSKMFGHPRLRCGAISTTNAEVLKALYGKAQTIKASMSGDMELKALAAWKYISATQRKEMFALFVQRQDRLIAKLDQMNKLGVTPVANLSRLHQEVPLYLYLGLPPNTDFVDFFVQTGIGGVLGEAFGDSADNNMIRLSMGMEPIQ